MAESTSLRSVLINESGTITTVTASGELGRRIRDMGLVPGAQITVVGRAPLKDPVALRLKGCTLTLRNSEADLIMVETLRAAGVCS
ncbi:FeoA family protein [Desulfomicrobium orale]|uniref:Iron transporter FeoA n=1 Tax=Desulfomicrobium orale DSM 12838 TaxID=888061 RepID=A0A0X8JPS9_9BACT|nr:FeoA family protein [Desulfomicrobium orale]AMD92663.1 iron transporter FeoA [Desulfomicrobium orale DSM 12838]